MLTRRIFLAIAVLVAGLSYSATFADPVLPEYKQGDVATEDIISPVTIRVVNPDLSAVLKQKTAGQVPLIFRQVTTATDEAEADLRASIDTARTTFLAALRRKLFDRMPNAGDVNSIEYANTVRAVAAWTSSHPPIARLAPWWVRGESDAAIVEALLLPLREVMTQPIIDDGGELLSVDEPIRLIKVKTMSVIPSLPDLEIAGMATTAANLNNLESARSVVKSFFPADQGEMAQFAARFLRANTFPAPGLTELLRSKLRDDVVVYDTYTTGQVIVKKGQTMDRKALAALASVREKKLIDVLLAKIESKPSAPDLFNADTKKLVAWFGGVGLVLLLILWRWGERSTTTELAVPLHSGMAPPALLGEANAESWRTRALIAEQRAEQAHEAIRQGALGWMREKLFRSVFRQRAELISAQQMAEAEMVELEQRLSQLLIPLQGRIKAYEKRIRELEEALATHEGNERRLIDARISRVKQQLELERARVGNDF